MPYDDLLSFIQHLKSKIDEINNSDIYIETNHSANSIVKICKKLLRLFGYSDGDLGLDIEDN